MHREKEGMCVAWILNTPNQWVITCEMRPILTLTSQSFFAHSDRYSPVRGRDTSFPTGDVLHGFILTPS